MGRFLLDDRAKFWSDLLLEHDAEPEMFIQRTIPGNVGERRQRDGAAPGFTRPIAGRFDELSSDASALVIRQNADLLDVSVAVDHIDDEITHDGCVSNRDPATTGGDVLREFGYRQGRVVGYLAQPDISELLPGKPLDLL